MPMPFTCITCLNKKVKESFNGICDDCKRVEKEEEE